MIDETRIPPNCALTRQNDDKWTCRFIWPHPPFDTFGAKEFGTAREAIDSYLRELKQHLVWDMTVDEGVCFSNSPIQITKPEAKKNKILWLGDVTMENKT